MRAEYGKNAVTTNKGPPQRETLLALLLLTDVASIKNKDAEKNFPPGTVFRKAVVLASPVTAW